MVSSDHRLLSRCLIADRTALENKPAKMVQFPDLGEAKPICPDWCSGARSPGPLNGDLPLSVVRSSPRPRAYLENERVARALWARPAPCRAKKSKND
jgi:hypothetical protein